MEKKQTEDEKVFDRQIRIPFWSQEDVSKQECLVLGTGGLGCTVGMALCRLGVKKITLVDNDTVDISNLNRQILFTKKDLGKKKVEVAAENLRNNHVVTNTDIIPVHACALKEWPKIIKLIQESTVVFNLIDVGDYFDVAVQSVAILYRIPYIVGGTFLHQLSVDFIDSKPTSACIKCMFDNLDEKIVDKLVPEKITEIKDLSFIPRNDNPVGQSNVYLASICAEMMVARFSTYLLHDPEFEKISFQRLLFFVSTGESVKFEVEKKPDCPICNFLKPAPKVVEKVPEEKVM